MCRSLLCTLDVICCHLSHSPPRQPKPQSGPQDALHSPPLGQQTKPRHLSHKLQILELERACILPPCSIMHLVTPKPSFSANLNLQIRLAELMRATPPGLHSTPGYRPSVCCHSSLLPKLQSLAGRRRYQPHRPPLVPVYN
jgi:hypothetical protein